MTEPIDRIREIARTTYSTNAAMDAEIRLMQRKVAAQNEEIRQSAVMAEQGTGAVVGADISGLIQEAQTLAALRFEYFELIGTMSALDVERRKIAAMPEDTAMQAAIKGAREQILWEKERQQALWTARPPWASWPMPCASPAGRSPTPPPT